MMLKVQKIYFLSPMQYINNLKYIKVYIKN